MNQRLGARDPDLEQHAGALIGTFGYHVAVEMVALYAQDRPADTYWPLLLKAVKKGHAAEGSLPMERREFPGPAGRGYRGA